MFLKVKVHPDSKRARIECKSPDSFEIWVKEPAERGLANRATLEALGLYIKVTSARLRIIKGSHSPNKIIQIIGSG